MADDIIIETHELGVQFLIEIDDINNGDSPMDLSTFSNFTLYLRRPDHITISFPMTFYTTGVDGLVQWISQTDVFTIVGQWRIQVSYQKSNSLTFTNHDTFMVEDNLTG